MPYSLYILRTISSMDVPSTLMSVSSTLSERAATSLDTGQESSSNTARDEPDDTWISISDVPSGMTNSSFS